MAHLSFLPEEREALAQALAKMAEQVCKAEGAGQHVPFTVAAREIIAGSMHITVEHALMAAVEHGNKTARQAVRIIEERYAGRIEALEKRIALLEAK